MTRKIKANLILSMQNKENNKEQKSINRKQKITKIKSCLFFLDGQFRSQTNQVKKKRYKERTKKENANYQYQK